MKQRDGFVFFWGKQDIASNWHPAKFTYKDREFVQAEQWMMYCKAMTFGDEAMAEKILSETDPAVNKKQGRAVQGFDEEIWNQRADKMVMVGLREKFLQNPNMLEWLLSTEGKQLAEASPYDKIWGIGLKANHPDATSTEKWPGKNKLGILLTDLRDRFLLEPEAFPDQARATIQKAQRAIAGRQPGKEYGVGSGPAY